MAMATEDLWVPQPENFAERLLEIRCVKLRLKQQEMADLLGVKRPTLATWEKGALPRDAADIAARYQEKLGISRTWILYGQAGHDLRCIDAFAGQQLSFDDLPQVVVQLPELIAA